METEQTLVLIKPDGVQRGLIGEVIARYEQKGLKIVGMKLLQLRRDTAEELYAIHHGKSFYDVLIEFMTSAPIVALAIEGRGVIDLVRTLNGETDPKESQPGSIRGDFSINITYNVVHASDSAVSAQRELEIVFAPDERYKYHRIDEAILHPSVVN
ncbi:nucleoside-diphosphate kinase [Candidatus Poribacteria bacterium]|nr:MAG: nucleoside-diphosphate kinase [Candidatus Poribacteria bacterium]